MNQQQMNINLPEGFEVADGKQPRKPKTGDYYLNYLGQAVYTKDDNVFHDDTRMIILEKKDPEYIHVKGYDGGDQAIIPIPLSGCDLVDMKALKDLLKIHDKRYNNIDLTDEEHAQLRSITKLVNGE